MHQFPKARNRDILEQDLDKELLIYDLQTNTAYSLNETSKLVYQSCDGEISLEEFKRQNNFDDDLIFFALDELNAKNLLEDYSPDNFPGMNRREVIKKVGLASMIALPVIASITAPCAANAASSGRRAVGQACADPTNSNDPTCVTNRCKSNVGTCCIPETTRDSFSCTNGNGATDCCNASSSCVNNKCCRTSNVQTCGSDPANLRPDLCCSGTCSFRTIGGTSAYFCG